MNMTPTRRAARGPLPMWLLAKVFTGPSTEDDRKLVWDGNRGFPRHAFPDEDLDCYVRRMHSLQQLLVERGRFSRSTAQRILVDSKAKTKERASAWLSTELRKLRNSERVTGAAPVLTRSALSRLTISDLAITMLQFLNEAPGTNLICLLQELLDVDRHRARRATEPGEAFVGAAIEEARGNLTGKSYGVRQLAKLARVNPSTISRWRRLDAYRKEVADQFKDQKERLRFLIEEAQHQGLSRAKAVEHALAAEKARSSLRAYRRELSRRLSVVRKLSDLRQVWERHVEHPMDWGAVSPSTRQRVFDLFDARLQEIES
jgi:hypothetical protein